VDVLVLRHGDGRFARRVRARAPGVVVRMGAGYGVASIVNTGMWARGWIAAAV